MNPPGQVPLKKARTLGDEFLIRDDFSSVHVHEWRLGYFSVVIPIWRKMSWVDEVMSTTGRPWFDFAAAPSSQWEYGRASGVSKIENPALTPHGFAKGNLQNGKFAFKAFYNDSRSRYKDMAKSFGSNAFDVLTDRNNKMGTHKVAPGDVFADADVAAHHYVFPREAGVTEFRLAGVAERVGPWRADDCEEDLYGHSTIRLSSVEVIQFSDFDLQSHKGGAATSSRVVSTFMVLNVVAENASSSSLNAISSSLNRSRRYIRLRDETSRIEELGQRFLPGSDPFGHGIFTSTAEATKVGETKTLRLFPYFVHLASMEIDRALGRQAPTMAGADGGYLILAPGASPPHYDRSLTETFGVQAKRVAFAIPNVQDPDRPEGAPGWRRSTQAPLPLADDYSEGEWTLEEQWAWVLSTGADDFVEVKPAQTRDEAGELVAARSGPWTMVTTPEGIGLARRIAASDDGTRYWSLASTRYIDLLILEMRAYGAFKQLSNELGVIAELSGAHSADFETSKIANQHEVMREDLLRLESVQRDFLKLRNRFWLETLPGREIDTKIMLALRDDMGVTELFKSLSAELDVRERIIHTQYDQLRIERNRERADAQLREQEARSEAEKRQQNILNFSIATLAAALAGPDWADAIWGEANGWNSTAMAVLAGVVTWALLVVVSVAVQRLLLRQKREQ